MLMDNKSHVLHVPPLDVRWTSADVHILQPSDIACVLNTARLRALVDIENYFVVYSIVLYLSYLKH